MDALDVKHNAFTSHPVFSSLPERDIDQLVNETTIESFPPNTNVFSTGDTDSCMFIIISGEISVLKTGEYIEGVEIARLVPGDSLGEIEMIAASARNASALAATEVTAIRFPPVGTTFKAWLDAHPESGSRVLFSFIADIAERTRTANALLKENSPQIQELRRQIYEDKQTGLHNRVYLEEQLPQVLSSTTTGNASLLMFKPDNFKAVNDSAGHEAGDALLVQLALRFPSILQKNSLLVRYAGNEFALVMKEANRDEASAMAEEIRKFYNTLDLASFLPVTDIRLTVSIGVACFPEHGDNATTLIEKAHALPLAGRAMGGNRILYPEPDKVASI
jgi:diguanylate cyclase (GGDEF)-like protein